MTSTVRPRLWLLAGAGTLCAVIAASSASAPGAMAGGRVVFVDGGGFKVATWNIRSGMGIRRTATSWNSGTTNCLDPSRPVNAWGAGLPQRELAAIRDDPQVVALAVQEAWNCGRPRHVNDVLRFAAATPERGGVALLARFGFDGEPVAHRLDAASDRWIVGGRVCLSAGCGDSVAMYSTHWGGRENADFPIQAAATLAFLDTQPAPRLFMGDLNVFQINQWNPRVPCTASDDPDRSRALALVSAAGYTDAWGATRTDAGATGMASRAGCGQPAGSYYKRIDYVFVHGLRVGPITRFAVAPPGGDAPSDHAGLVAELAVPHP